MELFLIIKLKIKPEVMQRFLLIFILIWCSIHLVSAQVVISETTFKKRLHYKVKTAHAEWFIDKYSGGITGIIDTGNNDWMNWKRLPEEKYPESAAGDYRGMPNFVFGGDENGIGHPGFDKALSFKENDRQIKVKSLDGKWEWMYIFHSNYVELLVLKNPSEERNYWFLYEGVPGGEFDPENQYWGTNEGVNPAKPDYLKGEEIYGLWNFVFFGHENTARVLFVVQKNKDKLKDIFGYLGNSSAGLKSNDGMVVFGFGRDKNAVPLLNQKNIFYIGFYEKKVEQNTFPEFYKYIQKTFY